MHRIIPLLLFVSSIAGLIGLFGLGQPTSLPDISAAYSFFFPQQQNRYFLFDRPLLLLVSLLFFLAAFQTYRKRHDHFTSLLTHITCYFKEADGSKVRVTRKQQFRANHPNVSAYFTTIYAHDGTISKSKDEIEFWAKTHDNQDLKTDIDIWGSEKELDIAHRCDPAFPFYPFRDLLPDSFRTDYVEREVRTIHNNGFEKKEDYYEISTARYPNKEVTIRIEFHPDHPPQDGKAVRVMANSVEDVPLVKTMAGERVVYEATFLKSRNERVRVHWNF